MALTIALAGLLALAPAEARFTDVSEAAGLREVPVEFASSTGHSLGVNWIDYDSDGWPDLFVIGGGPRRPPVLYRNLGNGRFEDVSELLPPLPTFEMSGSRFADVDNDGDPDIFIYTDNERFRVIRDENPPDGPPNILLLNRHGERSPEEGPIFDEAATAAGLDARVTPSFGPLPAYRSKAAAFFDIDRDGCIDLYVGSNSINNDGDASNRDALYRNRCDGTFEDITGTDNLYPTDTPDRLRSVLGAGGYLLDDDLWPDLYVINVSGINSSPFVDDFLFLNRGPDADTGRPVLEDVTTEVPGFGDDAMAGMGMDVADIDLDGDWDIYIADLLNTDLDALPLGNVLYLGNGEGHFTDNVAPAAGVVGDDSWGVNFFDFDADGWEDLFVTTIGPKPPLLYRNLGTGEDNAARFEDLGPDLGFTADDGRGSAVADYDRDGDLDIAKVNQRGPLELYRNDTVQGAWLIVRLNAVVSNRSAIGALVLAHTGDVVRRRQMKGGVSAHSQDELLLHFGLGDAERIDRLEVFWPGGGVTTLHDVAVNQDLTIDEDPLFDDSFE